MTDTKPIDLTAFGFPLKIQTPHLSGVKGCWKIRFQSGAIAYVPDEMFDRLVMDMTPVVKGADDDT